MQLVWLSLFVLFVSAQDSLPSEEDVALDAVQQRVTRLEDALQDIQSTLASLATEIKSLRQSLSTTGVGMSKGTTAMSVTGSSNVFDIDTGRHVFVYDWLVKDISRWNTTYQEDDDIKSPRFYIAPRSFRMFLIIFPVGRSDLPSFSLDYLGVYAGVARGSFDSLLKWPFSYRHDIIIVDRASDHPVHIDFQVRPGQNCGASNTSLVYQDVIVDRYQENYVCGDPFLIQRSLLQQKYIVDDTLLIRLKIYFE